MSWNNLVSSVREKLRRGLGLDRGHQITVASPALLPEQLGTTPLALPLVDVYENEKEFLIHADVPGGNPEEAIVAWDEGRGLTMLIKNQAPPAGELWASEYEPHAWYRAFALPEHIDGARATASFKDGVLSVQIPKRAAASAFIPVKAA